MGPMTALFNIVEDKHPPMPDNLSPELLDFLLKCFQRDPTLRPSAKELQEHSFIKKHVKQVEVPLDLDTVTGTIRQHNQSSKKKAAVFDVFGSNGLPPPTDTRDRSGSVTFAEPAVVSSGSNPQSRSLERERSGGALDHKERERAGSGPVGKKAKAPTKRRNPSRVEETTPNLNGTSRMSTMRQIEAANKDRTRFGLQADDLQHQLDNAVKERSAAAQRKAMMEKKLDRVLKDRRRILKQADGVSYFLREIGIRVSNLRDVRYFPYARSAPRLVLTLDLFRLKSLLPISVKRWARMQSNASRRQRAAHLSKKRVPRSVDLGLWTKSCKYVLFDFYL
jgi:hypothetical protein